MQFMTAARNCIPSTCWVVFFFAWANVRAFNSYANEKVIDPNWEAYACVLLEGKLNIETNEQSVSEK